MPNSDEPHLRQQAEHVEQPENRSDPLIEVATLIFKAARETPENGAVVYSGPGNARAAARFVHDNPGYVTLSDTPIGKALNDAVYPGGSHADRLKESEIVLLEGLASVLFVQNAKGQVQQFTGKSGELSIYRNIEIHALAENPRVTEGVERNPRTGVPLFLEGKDAMVLREAANATLAQRFDHIVDAARSADGLIRQAKLAGRELNIRADRAPAAPPISIAANGNQPERMAIARVEGIERSTALHPIGEMVHRTAANSVAVTRRIGRGVLEAVAAVFAFLGGFSQGRSSEQREETRSLDEVRRDHAQDLGEHHKASDDRQRTYDDSMGRDRQR